MENNNFEPYGKEWKKELATRPKGFLVDFIRNLIIKNKQLEQQQSTAIKMLKDLSQSTTASFIEIDEVIKVLEGIVLN